MKKPIQIDDSMDDMEWERARRVLATTATLAEASNILEEDPTAIYRRRRRKNEGQRSKQWESITEEDAGADEN